LNYPLKIAKSQLLLLLPSREVELGSGEEDGGGGVGVGNTGGRSVDSGGLCCDEISLTT
jgi:hypothetical protein